MASIREMVDAVSLDEIARHVRFLEGIRHPVAGPAALQRAERYLGEVLQGLGYALSEHSFTDGGATYSNVIATYDGSEDPAKRVLAVAHFDTVAGSPGADDNASGVAVLLEAARVLRSCDFKQTVQFVGMNLEEHLGDDYGSATRGSRALAAHARRQDWDIEAVVVLESVAYAGNVPQAAPPLPFPVPEQGDFLAAVANQASSQLLAAFSQAIERYAIALPIFPLVVPGNGELLPDTRRSDHARFWDQGYPALMLTDTANFRNPHYHQPTDTIETLNLPFAVQVCRATAALLAELGGVQPTSAAPSI